MGAPSHTLEQVLAMAAADRSFLQALRADRLGAVQARGLVLSDSAQRMLSAVSDQQLRAMLEQLAAGPPRGGELEPPVFASQGIRPTTVTTGIRIDDPGPIRGLRASDPGPVKGIRPGRVLAVAAAATAVTVGVGLASMTHGNRPDVPPAVTETAHPGAEPKSADDAGPPETGPGEYPHK